MSILLMIIEWSELQMMMLYSSSIVVFFRNSFCLCFLLLLFPLSFLNLVSFLLVYSIFSPFRSISQQPLLFTKWLLSRDLFVTLFGSMQSIFWIWCVPEFSEIFSNHSYFIEVAANVWLVILTINCMDILLSLYMTDST